MALCPTYHILIIKIWPSQHTHLQVNLPPPTHRLTHGTFSAGGSNCGRKTHQGNETKSNTSHQPPEEKKQEQFLPPFLFFSTLVSISQGFCMFSLTATFSFERICTIVHTHARMHTQDQAPLSKSSLGWHIELFWGQLRAWLHALFIPQAYSFYQRRRN